MRHACTARRRRRCYATRVLRLHVSWTPERVTRGRGASKPRVRVRIAASLAGSYARAAPAQPSARLGARRRPRQQCPILYSSHRGPRLRHPSVARPLERWLPCLLRPPASLRPRCASRRTAPVRHSLRLRLELLRGLPLRLPHACGTSWRCSAHGAPQCWRSGRARTLSSAIARSAALCADRTRPRRAHAQAPVRRCPRAALWCPRRCPRAPCASRVPPRRRLPGAARQLPDTCCVEGLAQR